MKNFQDAIEGDFLHKFSPSVSQTSTLFYFCYEITNNRVEDKFIKLRVLSIEIVKSQYISRNWSLSSYYLVYIETLF